MTSPKPNLDHIIKYGTVGDALRGLLTGHLQPDAAEMLKFLATARSGTEAEWLSQGHIPLIENVTGQKVVFWNYEWVTFRLPGASYTPDYFYLLDNGIQVYVEVKGSKAQANYRDARSKLRAAASLNPWARFFEARVAKRAWDFEEITPDIEFIKALVRFAEDAP